MSDFSREWHNLDNGVKGLIQPFLSQEPVPLGAIANTLGIEVKRATLPNGISGEIKPSLTARSGFQIRVNRHESIQRQRFTLAHEIGHFLLHRDQIGNGVEDDRLYRSALSNRTEAEANRLAADLIMPWDTISSKLDSEDTCNREEIASQLASDLGVSITAMRIRLGLED